jgi:cytosine/adenosine deaminase-related metal-dependent hydrolase
VNDLLFRSLRAVVSSGQGELLGEGSWVACQGSQIAAIGIGGEEPEAKRVVDLPGHILFPGMVNTHHHLYQSLFRCVPEVQKAPLFDWLVHLYTRWRCLTEEAVDVSTRVGCGELLLSGCTTTSDHLYLFPAGTERLIDREIEAAAAVGIRFHPTRGSMTRGARQGGLPPDDVVQSAEAILEDSVRLAETYHDPSRFSMTRLGLAPCSPFSVEEEIMVRTAEMARERGLRLHTHLCETEDEERYCLETYGCRPIELAERVGWLGEDVWFAHAVHLNEEELERLAETGTGVAHCPSSNCRLGSGRAPFRAMRRLGVPMGLGVDGSSSNDGGNLLAEARMAMIVHRPLEVPCEDWPSASEVLEVATEGGARVLGRDDLGRVEVGLAADLVAIDTHRLAFAGACVHDPLAALLYCSPNRPADWVVVNGKVVVERGKLVTLDEAEVTRRADQIAQEMSQRM